MFIFLQVPLNPRCSNIFNIYTMLIIVCYKSKCSDEEGLGIYYLKFRLTSSALPTTYVLT